MQLGDGLTVGMCVE